jgi:hypothetical protein
MIKIINEEPLEPDLIRYSDDVVMMKQYEIVIKKFNKLFNYYR